MCRGLRKLFSPCAQHLLDTSYLLRFKNFRILIWFSWNLWMCLWTFFSFNPRHIKGLFWGPSKGGQVVQALSKLCSSKLWPKTKFCPSSSLLKKLLCMCTVGFCDQASSWSSSCGWIEEFCSQQPSLVGDWSHVLGSTQLVSHILGSRASKGEIVTIEQVQLGIRVSVQL